MNETTYTVGEVARQSGATVRALHHYDEIGLLAPSRRSDSGYRLYTREDLERLQLILFYKELGSSLEDIAAALASDRDRSELLEEQRSKLVADRRRIGELIAAIDFAIGAERSGVRMDEKEMFEVFGDFDPTEHAAEAERRWPDTDAESHARTSRYTKADWAEAVAEMDEVSRRFAAVREGGAAAASEEAMSVAEDHRRHIDTWYYVCDHVMHSGLGEMYVADPRFTAYWERYGEGLAVYVRDAIVANAASRG